MKGSTYVNFDLIIEKSGEKYRARVINSPCGQATVEFGIPFSPLELENFVLRMGRPRRGMRRIDSPEMYAAKELGKNLFNTVFSGEVNSCYLRSVDNALSKNTGLRVRLHINVPEFNDYPWEFLYNPQFGQFVALSQNTPIIRYIELPYTTRPLAVQMPLKILVMISSPEEYPLLDVEKEWEKLNRALKPLLDQKLVVLEKLEIPTLSALQKHLRQDQVHIFHYIGHGKYFEDKQDGMLLLEDEHGHGRPTSGQHLGAILHDHYHLRLVVLNACEGARTSSEDPYAGVAQTLIRQGIPAVLAMQFEIFEDAAMTFAEEFYSAIVDNYPVDAALSEARKAIFASDNDVEWGTPVLFMRTPDGVLFRPKSPEERAAHLEEERKRQEQLKKETEERTARHKAKQAAEKATKEKAEREAAKKAAREKAEREAAEKAAKEKAEREAAEKAAIEKAELKAAEIAASEKSAKEIAEREAAEKTERERKERDAILAKAYEEAYKEKAEREAAEKAAKKRSAHEKAEHEVAEKTAKEAAGREKEGQNVVEKATHVQTQKRLDAEGTLKTILQKLRTSWRNYVPIGFILLCLVCVVGGIWMISSSIQKQIDSFYEMVDDAGNRTPSPKPTSSIPTPLVLAGTHLPFTPPEITAQNAAQIVQLTARDNISSLFGQMVYSPDSKMLAVAQLNKIILYDSFTLNQIRYIDTEKGFFNIVFSPDGSTLASGTSDGGIQLFLVNDGSLLQTLRGHTDTVQSVAFSPDGLTLASGSGDADKTIRLWQVRDGTLLQTLEGYQGYSSKTNVAFSPDGSILASGYSGSESIQLWNVSDGNLIKTLKGGSDRVECLAFSPDGSTLAAGTSDGHIRFWRIHDGNLIQTLDGHTDAVLSIVFSPDGTILVSRSSSIIKLWLVSDNSLLQTFDVDRNLVSVDYSPDGTTIASSDFVFGGGAIRLWGVKP